MTEKANPSINRPATAFHTAGAIGYGGHSSRSDPGFVVDGASPTEIAQQDGIDETQFDTFSETSSASSFGITIAPGEAFVFGSWIAKDTDTSLSLPSSSTTTVYVGWNKNGTNDVIIGTSSAFSNASGDTDLKIPLWTFTTDGSGVTSVTDERRIGYTIGETTVDGVLSVRDDIRLNDDDGQQFITVGSDSDELSITETGGTSFGKFRVLSREIELDTDGGFAEVLNGPIRAPSFEDSSGNTMMSNVAASGQVTLTSNNAVVDTGISAIDATFTLAIGIDDPDADTKVSGRLFWDDSSGTYKVELVENGTDVGNPTVNYDIIRVR
ncbi:hypothetical protein M199_gp031 [Halogranum tailed virus 1]|uniref:Uncharacterized protein n=1 Tax=Halogranum tailed virus 1 TaxID=1273749 RepID=R4TGI8_9CAUD|nr:hypothetical protein M199_gp031 [Halogranum tailed virus 1]AGM11361.1 hypothetical protein HGTV1_31 [Halogranum tailed virus 1]